MAARRARSGTVLLAVSLCSLMPAVLCAQERKDPKPGDVMIEKYLAAETDKLSAKFLDGAKTIKWKQNGHASIKNT
jgi:hypothetical protein